MCPPARVPALLGGGGWKEGSPIADVYVRDSNLTEYAGFAKEWRNDNRVKPGTVIRSVEHGENTARVKRPQAKLRRYRDWRRGARGTTGFLHVRREQRKVAEIRKFLEQIYNNGAGRSEDIKSLSDTEVLELAGNLTAFDDGVCHPTLNVDDLDPECELPNLVLNKAREIGKPDYVLNNSFGMLGINSVVIMQRY